VWSRQSGCRGTFGRGALVMSLQSIIPLAMKSSLFVSVFALGLDANSDDVTYILISIWVSQALRSFFIFRQTPTHFHQAPFKVIFDLNALLVGK
jgi:hypothetical protein